MIYANNASALNVRFSGVVIGPGVTRYDGVNEDEWLASAKRLADAGVSVWAETSPVPAFASQEVGLTTPAPEPDPASTSAPDSAPDSADPAGE